MQSPITKYNKDYYGGGLMVLLGLGAMLQGSHYPIGSLSRMGPGFFPVALGAILALTGLAIAAGARASVPEGEETVLPPEWRGWICIVAGIVAFVVLGRYGGLLPATFAIVFISALGDRQNTVKSAFVLAIAMVAVCVLVFWWALQMQFSLFQWGGA
jgi:putative tricarboxylic transport membrane protein